MYIAISPQKLGSSYSNSVSDYVAYLEKENETSDRTEHFFTQTQDEVSPEMVIQEIDGNTSKLKKTEPKFYSLVVSPSQRELKAIQNNPEALKKYTRELMKDYAASFYRTAPITIDQIKYYAKIEHERTYRGFEKQLLENAPYRKKIAQLHHTIRKVDRGEIQGDIQQLKNEISQLEIATPHKINGKPITVGMKKEGVQMHVHIIVSRKDVTNTFSLSPGAKYKASQVEFNGKMVQRGFHRDAFYEQSEKTFDTLFNYKRNYVETYRAKKTLVKDPRAFQLVLHGLPLSEKQLALKLLSKTGMRIPSIPTNQVQLALKIFNRLKRGVKTATRSASIGI